ncbi:MAG: twin-arginine translocase TatA/TatE family subunit [SAR202 cluster bacterium]|nr:twin-arginine translocase TatA/TatE family subunit [SAR202 cluster bacterium]
MFRSFGPLELLIIFGVILLLFGATRLPKLAQSMGQAIREFRKGTSGEQPPAARQARKPRARPSSRRNAPPSP